MNYMKRGIALLTLSLLTFSALPVSLADAPATMTPPPTTTETTTPPTTTPPVTPTTPQVTPPPTAEVTTPPVPAPVVVTFKDKKLEAALRVILKKKTGDLMSSDMEKITSLKLAKQGITNLDGLKYFTNLTTLDVSNNPLKTVVPVVLCSKLTKLDLRGTQVNPNEWASLKSFMKGLTITSDPIEKLAKFTATTTIYVYTLNTTKETMNLWAGEADKVPDSTLVEPGGMRYFWVTIKGYYMTEADKKANKPVYMAGKIRVNVGKDGKVLTTKQFDIAQPYATTLYFSWNGTSYSFR